MHRVSPRAKQVWLRLMNWYGARLADQYGDVPSVDWCHTIDDAKPDVIERALAEIKIQHPVHPPTYPEFDAVVSQHSRAFKRGPTTHERIVDFILAHRELRGAQRWMPWEAHFVEGQCVFVAVPADGDIPGFRVLAADLPRDDPWSTP